MAHNQGRTIATERTLIIKVPLIGEEIALPELVSGATKGGMAILDQALFAGANFLVNILLARWLTPAEYGAFALAYSVFLLFGAFHTAILTEPMMVFGAGRYGEWFRKYLGMLIRGHFALMVPGSFLLVGAAFLLGRLYSINVKHAFLGLALAAPFILLVWLVRRAFYVRLQPGWAAVGGGLYLLFLFVLTYALNVRHWLSPVTAFLGMGVSALVVSLFLLSHLRLSWRENAASPTLATVANDHWRYGRWSMATAGLIWFPGNIYYALLPAWIGLEGTGALRALTNLAMPVLHGIAALSMVLLPVLVRTRQKSGIQGMARKMKLALALFVSGAGFYLLVLWAFRIEIFQLLYAGKYASNASLPLLLVGLLPFAGSVTAVLGSGLRALERPDWIFWCYVGSSFVALAIGVPLAATMGVGGALGGMLLSTLTTGALMLLFYRRSLLQQEVA